MLWVSPSSCHAIDTARSRGRVATSTPIWPTQVYTECPVCKTLYRLHPALLRESRGIARCTGCGNTFDTRDTLRTGSRVIAATPKTPDTSQPHRAVTFGDRVVIVHDTRPAEPCEAPPHLADEAPAISTGDSLELESPQGKAVEDEPTASPRWRSVGEEAPFLSLALRNLSRHRHRAYVALASISFGVIAMLVAGGFIEWVFASMREGVIESRLGNITVVKRGYLEDGVADPFAYLLSEESGERELIAGLPHVSEVAPRLAFTGLVSHGNTTVSFIGEGVDPGKENRLSRFVLIQDGEGLSSEERTGIIVGAGLAANLGVKPGDVIVLLSTTSSGGINAIEGRVRGLFATSTKAYDDSALRVHIDVARELLRVTGSHKWVVLLDDTNLTDEVTGLLAQSVGSQGTDFQFVPWYEQADFYNKTVSLFSRQMNVVRLVITLIIVLSISNTLIMNVMERTSEIGTLMAIGLRRSKILRLFVYEGVLLGVFGGLLGVTLAYVLAQAISAVGIPMPPPPGMDIAVTGRIFLTWPLAMLGLLLAVGATGFASLYPAWKASRLEIVDTLRHGR